MFRPMTISLVIAAALALPLAAQDSKSDNNTFDVRSSVGDLHVGADADAMERRHRVGRRVPHPGVAVEHHDAVADARLGHRRAVVGERERAVRDHRHEAAEDGEVGALQLAGLAWTARLSRAPEGLT